MICERCLGEIPEIIGLKYCPFCNKKLWAMEEAKNHYVYSREHFRLCQPTPINAQELQSFVSHVVKRQLGIDSKKRIHLCNDSAVELWNNICLSVIKEITNILNGGDDND